ncbi:MAG TPA: prepilin-type N-terminal cleavage/methylation domain-containing protein [Mariprofundaceae bacterium]|nr:prepilin-type N-terminal cleavage/methylation domain-containing protein [Mariprofundaceae bacterium]
MNNLKTLKAEKGFTLIELMIVVAIIGILAAIAIPQFSAYRIKAFNSAAESDLRNTKLAEEALFTDYQLYGTSVANTALAAAVGAAGNGAIVDGAVALGAGNVNSIATTTVGQAAQIGVSNQVQLRADVDATLASYIITTKHTQGDRAFATDSDATAVYWVQNTAAWVGKGIVAAPVTIPASTPGADNIQGTAGGGAPSANWAPL